MKLELSKEDWELVYGRDTFDFVKHLTPEESQEFNITFNEAQQKVKDIISKYNKIVADRISREVLLEEFSQLFGEKCLDIPAFKSELKYKGVTLVDQLSNENIQSMITIMKYSQQKEDVSYETITPYLFSEILKKRLSLFNLSPYQEEAVLAYCDKHFPKNVRPKTRELQAIMERVRDTKNMRIVDGKIEIVI